MENATTNLTATEALRLIRESDGKFFSVEFTRVQPKCVRCETAHDAISASAASGMCETAFCHACNRKLGKREAGICKVCGEKAQICGGSLEFVRQMTGRLGVQNPGEGITAPGTGAPSVTGGFKDRLERAEPVVTVYDVGAEGDRTDGKTGGYRSFRLSNLVSLSTGGVKYAVK